MAHSLLSFSAIQRITIFASLTLLSLTLRAQTTITDNLGRPEVGGVGLLNAGDAEANAFVPSIDCYVTSITVKLDNFNGGAGSQASAKLWSGSGNLPVTEIASLPAQSFSSNGPEDVQFTFTTRPRLEANTRYWVSVHFVSGDFDWILSSSGTPFGVTFGNHLDELALSSNNGSSWSDDDGPGEFAKMRVLVDEHLVTNVNDSGTGSLREAIANANNGEVITFDPSLSGQTITLTSATLTIEKDLSIDASGLPNGIIISGDNARGVFLIRDGDVTLDTLTIRDGDSLRGGGIDQIEGNLTIRNSLITNCRAVVGGGIDSVDGAILLENCTITGNTASTAGGISILNNSLTIKQSTMAENTASGFADNLRANDNVTATNSIIASPGDTTTTSSIFGAISGSNNIIGMDPLLGPLADNGGPTQTMLPLPGSPAIDGGGVSALTTDQRGFSRTVGSAPDIGAAELQERIVTIEQDVDDGPFLYKLNGISLREAINHAGPGEGEIIRFAANLSGQTIYLTSQEQLTIDRDVFIDGSTLPKSVVISGDADKSGDFGFPDVRVFEIVEGNTVHFDTLTITGGYVSENFPASENLPEGGGIRNSGALFVDNSTIHGNAAITTFPNISADGGAIFSDSYLNLNNTTITNNTADFVGSTGFASGSAIYALGSVYINHCTVAENTTDAFSSALAFISQVGGEFTIYNTLMIGNYSGGEPSDLFISGQDATVSLQNNIREGLLIDDGIIPTPLLPLGDYGGPTLDHATAKDA